MSDPVTVAGKSCVDDRFGSGSAAALAAADVRLADSTLMMTSDVNARGNYRDRHPRS